MPLYEYECEACGHRFEQIQSFSDPAVDTCPVCGGPVRKLMSMPAIQFKGSGWYITDYARKGQTPDQEVKGEKSTDKGSDSSKSAESGAKSAASTDRDKSSPASDSSSSSSPAASSTGSSSSDS
jgi:putative FmdB family regulatory protein